MLYIILLIELFLFGLVFYRLVTTNHWTIGKKLLVGLVAGVIVESAGMMLAMICSLDPITLVYIKIPKVIISSLLVYFFYRNGLEIN